MLFRVFVRYCEYHQPDSSRSQDAEESAELEQMVAAINSKLQRRQNGIQKRLQVTMQQRLATLTKQVGQHLDLIRTDQYLTHKDTRLTGLNVRRAEKLNGMKQRMDTLVSKQTKVVASIRSAFQTYQSHSTEIVKALESHRSVVGDLFGHQELSERVGSVKKQTEKDFGQVKHVVDGRKNGKTKALESALKEIYESM